MTPTAVRLPLTRHGTVEADRRPQDLGRRDDGFSHALTGSANARRPQAR